MRRFRRATIGFLKFCAPIFQVIQINPLARNRAEHKLSWTHDIKMWRVIIQHGKTWDIGHQSPVNMRSTNCFTVGTNPLE